MQFDDGTDGPSDATPFIDALEDGDLEKAILILRERKALSEIEILKLADLLDPTYELMSLETIRLQVKHRKAGKPVSPWVARKLNEDRVVAIRKHLLVEKKVELAIAVAAGERGESVPLLRKVWSKHKNMQIPYWRI